jgi:hypothetical protein
MAKKPASVLARIMVATCAGIFRVDTMALQIVTSPVLVRALIETVGRQLVDAVDHFGTLSVVAGGAVVREHQATKQAQAS